MISSDIIASVLSSCQESKLMAAGMTIPLGWKFKFEPLDHELLTYLACKCKGQSLPAEGLIKEVDLYRITDPGILFGRTDAKVVYVFTKLKKVTKNGKRVDRTVFGNRTWKGVDGGQRIYDAKGCLLGEKKNFVLINKMKMTLGYNMKEFSLDKDVLRNSRFEDYVVCQIKKKPRKARGHKDGNSPEECTSDAFVCLPEVMACSEGNLMPVPNAVFDGDNLVGLGYLDPYNLYQENNSWMIGNTVGQGAEESKELMVHTNLMT